VNPGRLRGPPWPLSPSRLLAPVLAAYGLAVRPGAPKVRPWSKSLTYDQADALLAAAKSRPLYAYIVVSLLTGARTEELRALTWSHVDLDATPPVIMVWRSVRAGGDTKTRKSRRTLELPQRCTDALRLHRDRQNQLRMRAGDRWHDNDLVFASRVGTALWAGNIRRSFRAHLGR
jgi:integrase